MSNIRNNSLYVPAFSFVDTIVGMVITAIIMGILFVIFSIISERMIDFKNQNQLVNDLNRLSYCLNKDIFENEKMTSLENEIKFTGYNGNKVSYQFSDNYMLRNSEVIKDTFQIKVNQMFMDTLKGASGQFVFQKIKLKLVANEKNMDLSFYKRIYPNELLQIKQKNEF